MAIEAQQDPTDIHSVHIGVGIRQNVSGRQPPEISPAGEIITVAAQDDLAKDLLEKTLIFETLYGCLINNGITSCLTFYELVGDNVFTEIGYFNTMVIGNTYVKEYGRLHLEVTPE